ncbi:MAG: TonB-dependent receptor family protein [Chitinophagaceae bacterium]|nr:TonB-dependent receptor family protein [Chitinophagaceae bacterium]
MQYAVISLLQKSDSSLYKFVRTDKNGDFSLTGLPEGLFTFIISYPSYADYVEDIELKPGADISLGNINLINKSALLEEIIIRQNNAMRIKGDTIEYAADSFKVRANASAEELLKAMPGIQVDKNGKIIAQGQEVQKVLVDGEEFFSDDPTVATRNIRADAVDKVQVFDKKSDQAAFTGIDDGEKTKTINLKLKGDKKNGYFGKLSAGGGLKDKFNNEAMVNFFKGKRKMAAFGTMSNTGETGLNWQDSRKYGASEDNFEYNEDDGFIYSFGGYDAFSFNGNGLPKAWTGGAHFSNKWNDDKQNFNTSYMYKKFSITGNEQIKTQYILPDTLYYINQRNSSFSQRYRNTLFGKYEIQLDSTSSLKFSFNGYTGRTNNDNTYYTEALNEDEGKVNASTRKISGSTDESSLNTKIIYRKKFKKTGRTITASTEQKYTDNNSKGYLDALNSYFEETGDIFRNDTINQQKYNHTRLFNFNGKITYTEPIIKDNYIVLNYGISHTSSSADRTTYDYENGKYDVVNPLLTNDYDFIITTNAGGIAYRIAKKKYNITFGSDLGSQDYTQKDILKGSTLHYTRLNLFPKANISYNFKPQTSLYFNYNGNTQQPTIQQIQPIPENEDPLNIFTGNPELKAAFNHRFNIYFNDYKVLKQRGIYANFNLNITDNAITTSNTIDKFGKRIYQSVNSEGAYNYNSYISYNMQVPSIKTWLYATINNSGSRMINFVNNEKNITHNTSTSGRLSGSFAKEEKMSIRLGTNVSYNTSISSINKAIKTKYWVHSYTTHLYFALPFKLEFTNDVDFNFRQKTSVFDQNRNNIIWNTSLGKQLFKETCSLDFSVNDILNQNIGFRRDIQSNFITESTYSNIRRFWMLSFTWNFSKNTAQAQK